MSRIDVYLRSIRQLGAQGAILSSGQAVTLRFPAGDRHATQITPHDQLVALVREVAPPQVVDQIDRGRPASFELDAGGRWSIQVAPRAGVWHVAIDPLDAAGAAVPVPSPTVPLAGPPPRPPARPATVQPPAESEMAIERGPYAPIAGAPAPAGSGSPLLDALTSGARAASASDIYLSAGVPAYQRIGGDLAATADRTPIDGEVLARELGVVAPNEARTAWAERGTAAFTYGDGTGRVRVTLTRDHRGPGATLRLLPAEPPSLASLGLDRVTDWLRERGLVLVAGPSGSGKTCVLAALVRALGEQRRRVISIEDPIEIVHASGWISQRAVGEHVPGIADAVAGAMREGADAIVIAAVRSAGESAAVVEAVAGGHLVATTLAAPRAGVGPDRLNDQLIDRLIDRLPVEQRDGARALCVDALLGVIGPAAARSGRAFEAVAALRRTVG